MTQLMKLPDLKKELGISRTGIYAAVASGDFPAQIKISSRSVAWIREEVEEWVAKRKAARDAAQAAKVAEKAARSESSVSRNSARGVRHA
ncbi:MAG: AlpA family phage regulatory protein [Zoogloeaceae bacterium]|jgi:prophage regulatory protein|nr:AlpA family phage regulatory protein [Zoogloeaceae bacterium]